MAEKYLEVNLHNLYHNIEVLKHECDSQVLFMAVVKSNAYGHGIVKIGKAIEPNVDYLGAGLIEEAVQLRESGIKKPILLMGPTDQFEMAANYDITLGIFSIDQMKALIHYTNENEKSIHFHLKVNTGMNRFGVMIDELDEFFQLMDETSYLQFEGVYSHFATTYKTSKKTVLKQKAKFDQFIQVLKPHYRHLIYHICNSENAVDYKEAHYNMIRVGNALYGPCNSLKKIHLKKIAKVKAKIIETKWINKGEYIGYGNYFKAKKPTKIGIIEFGFYEGLGLYKKPIGTNSKSFMMHILKEIYRYLFRGKTVIYFHGKPLKILGVPNMQFTIVDLTQIKDLSDDYVDIRISPIFIKDDMNRNYISEV